MFKIFDYFDARAGWTSFASYEDALREVNKRFDSYWLFDKDNCMDFFIEIYSVDTNEYTVWCLEAGSWVCEDTPYDHRYYGSRKEFEKSINLTSLNPNKEYIII